MTTFYHWLLLFIFIQVSGGINLQKKGKSTRPNSVRFSASYSTVQIHDSTKPLDCRYRAFVLTVQGLCTNLKNISMCLKDKDYSQRSRVMCKIGNGLPCPSISSR